MKLKKRGVLLMLITALVFMTFAATLRFGFLEHDDDQNIVKNPDLQALSFDQLATFWTRPHLGLYIPVTYTYWGAGVALSRLGQDPNTPQAPNPSLFHAGNLLLHIMNGWLLWLLLVALGAKEWGALLGCLLFLLHPMQVEAVSWITGAKDLLCGFLSLASTLIFLRYLQKDPERSRRNAPIYYLAATILSVLAILAKPAAVVLPFVFFILASIYSRRSWWRHLLMIIPQLIVGILVVKTTSIAQIPEGPLPVVLWWQRPLVAGDAVLFYVKKLFWPFGFAVDYARRPDIVAADLMLCLLAFIPMIVGLALVYRRRQFPLLFVSLLTFGILLAPNLGLISFSNQFLTTVCDRYAYLAMTVPAFLLSRLSLDHLKVYIPKITARGYYASFAIILVFLAALSNRQVNYWANERALFQHSIDIEPNGVMALVGLGNDAANNKNWDDSIKYFSSALNLRPDWGRVHNNLGNSFINVNRLIEATESLQRAISVFPAYPLAFNNLCGALARREMWEEAAAACRNALRLAPDFYMSYQNLGYIAAKQGQNEKAEQYFRDAIRIAPIDIPPRMNLVRILKIQEKLDKLSIELEVLSRMLPQDINIALDLAATYEKLGKVDQARAVFKNFPLDPSDTRSAATIHAALQGLGGYR